MTDDTTRPASPAPSTRPRWTAGLWGLALLVVGAIGLGAGHQWGLYDRSQVGVDVAATGGPSQSTSPSASTSAAPSPSASGEATEVAPACKAADKYVKDVVRRSDLTAEHPRSTKDVTACRWVSETYPRVTVSVVAGSELDDIVGVLDDIWTDPAPMTNPFMYQYSDSSLIGYWKDPDGPTEGAARLEGMGVHELPTDEGMAAMSLAAQIAQAHRDR